MINNLINGTSSQTQSSSGTLGKDPIIMDIQRKSEATRIQEPAKTEQSKTGTNQDQKPNNSQISDSVNKLNDELRDKNLQLNYTQDKDTGQTIVQIKDIKTNEVVRQIPTKEMVAISKSIDEFISSYNNKGVQNKSANVLPILDDIA